MGDPSLRALANVREKSVELFAGLPFPATDLTKEVRDGLPGRFDARDRQLPINPDAHRLRRVALEGLDRLVEG